MTGFNTFLEQSKISNAGNTPNRKYFSCWEETIQKRFFPCVDKPYRKAQENLQKRFLMLGRSSTDKISHVGNKHYTHDFTCCKHAGNRLLRKRFLMLETNHKEKLRTNYTEKDYARDKACT